MSDTPEQTDEELAAAWGADTELAAAAEGGPPARELNQAEIDSLLGFDAGPASGEARTGMQKIISSGLISYERCRCSRLCSIAWSASCRPASATSPPTTLRSAS